MLNVSTRVVILMGDNGNLQKVQLYPGDQHLRDVQSGPVRE